MQARTPKGRKSEPKDLSQKLTESRKENLKTRAALAEVRIEKQKLLDQLKKVNGSKATKTDDAERKKLIDQKNALERRCNNLLKEKVQFTAF